MQVVYTADSLTLDLLSLGRDGHDLVSVIGDVEWTCRDVGPGSPLAFKTVRWNSTYSEILLVMDKKKCL